MKKKILIISVIIVAVAIGVIVLSNVIFIMIRNSKEKSFNVDIPYVNNFTCDYYKDGYIIEEKYTHFSPYTELVVKISFTISSKAYAAGKRDLTLKFAPPNGFDGKFLSANSSTTSSKDFTVLYTVDDKKDKKCEIELQINVFYSAGSLVIDYAYDDEEYTEAGRFPLSNVNTLQYDYDAATDGYIVSQDLDASYWFDKVEEFSIPDSFAGKPITGIRQNFFINWINVRKIEIPDSIVSFGTISGCGNLQYNDYGNACYLGNKDNPYIALVKPVNKDVTNVSINKSTKIICSGAFSDCGNLTSVDIPDGVTIIEDGAFKNCGVLTSVTVPDSITNVGKYAFYGCNSLTYNKFENVGYLGNEKNQFSALVKTIGIVAQHVNVNDGTKVIGAYAFSDCGSLASISIPDGVTSIGSGAFNGCSSLTSVTIPNSVTRIRNDAFRDCEKLTSVTLPDGITCIEDNVFRVCKKLTNIIIPDSVVYIGNYAFTACPNLANVSIPDSLTIIGEFAFGGCGSLTSIEISNGVTSIGRNAFSDCSGLTSITIPNSVTSIEEYTFIGCNGLTSITIPKIPYLWKGCFFGCNNLTSIVYGGTIAEWKSISSDAGESSDDGNVTMKCTDGELKFTFYNW